MPEELLRSKCIMCGSYKWCGRPCQHAPPPGQVFVEMPGDVQHGPPDTPKPANRNAKAEKGRKPVSGLVPTAPRATRKARQYLKGEQVSHAKPGRPKSGKTPVFLRLDQDLVEHFRNIGPGWQRLINDALRQAVFRDKR
jgi:uncharacterized protein (DUF4415 family)